MRVFRDATGAAEEIGFVDDRYDSHYNFAMYLVVASDYANFDIGLHGRRHRCVYWLISKSSYEELLCQWSEKHVVCNPLHNEAGLIGIPLAFFTTRFKIRGKAWIQTLAILVLVSPPFIGAYAWIMMLGSNGFITNAFKAIGLETPTIYNAPGIILVFSLKFFPFIFLMTQTALNNVNKSFEDAAENLGCNPWQRFRKITLPLVFPAVSTGAIICFVLSIADFGTPAILGRGFRTLSTIALGAYRSELVGAHDGGHSIHLDDGNLHGLHWLYTPNSR